MQAGLRRLAEGELRAPICRKAKKGVLKRKHWNATSKVVIPKARHVVIPKARHNHVNLLFADTNEIVLMSLLVHVNCTTNVFVMLRK